MTNPAMKSGGGGRARLPSRTFELSSFLVRVLKVEDVGARWPGRVTWHERLSCVARLESSQRAAASDWECQETEFVELENATPAVVSGEPSQ